LEDVPPPAATGLHGPCTFFLRRQATLQLQHHHLQLQHHHRQLQHHLRPLEVRRHLPRLHHRQLLMAHHRLHLMHPQQEPEHQAVCNVVAFFFAFDPNIGLWNDRVNPNWRLTFTDSQSNEKQRVPYAFAIQHKGPHFELGLRLQFGYVVCGATFDAVPEKFNVESGWEVTFPLPLGGVRFCHTIICTDDTMGTPALATVYCVDIPVGFTAGFQRAAYGVGLKGKPELSWRNQFAMVAFVGAVLWGIYNLVTLPVLWRDTIQEILKEDDDMDVAMFKALDIDGDGYITLPDVEQFVRQSNLSIDANELFRELDTEGTGRVNLDQFQDSLEALLEAQERLNATGGIQPGNVDLKPFGGIFTPGLAQPGVAQPFGGAFNPGLMPPMAGMPPRAKPPGRGFSEL